MRQATRRFFDSRNNTVHIGIMNITDKLYTKIRTNINRSRLVLHRKHSKFVGFAEVNSPELTMLWKELKQEYAKILKKYKRQTLRAMYRRLCLSFLLPRARRIEFYHFLLL